MFVGLRLHRYVLDMKLVCKCHNTQSVSPTGKSRQPVAKAEVELADVDFDCTPGESLHLSVGATWAAGWLARFEHTSCRIGMASEGGFVV